MPKVRAPIATRLRSRVKNETELQPVKLERKGNSIDGFKTRLSQTYFFFKKNHIPLYIHRETKKAGRSIKQ